MTISITGKKAALVNSDGIVENIIVWQEGDSIPTDHTIAVLDAEHPVNIGDRYRYDLWRNLHEFFPTNPQPESITQTEPEPTLAELQAQLAELTAKINKLAGIT